MIENIKRLIRCNPISFFLGAIRDYSKMKNEAIQCRHPEILAELKARGFCVIQNFVAREDIEAIKDNVEEYLVALSHGNEVKSEIQTTSYPQFQTYVLHQVQDFSSVCLKFVKDDVVNDVVQAYSGGQAKSFGAIAELRSQPAKNELVDDWHTDTWKFRFKAMLYLTDVSPETSPFCYLACSHIGKFWRWQRFLYNYLRFAFPDSLWAIRFYTKFVQHQLKNPAFQKIQCLGQAGTLILFDTRGIHRGSSLQKSRRLILNHTFFL